MTFEKVWATIQESNRVFREEMAEMSREADLRRKEADTQRKKDADQRRKEADAQRKKEADQRKKEDDLRKKEDAQRKKKYDLRQEAAERTMEDLKQTVKRVSEQLSVKQTETARIVEETTRTVKRVSEQLGGMANSDGDAAEELFATSLASKMTFAGQHYDYIDYRVKRKKQSAGSKEIRAEFDILLYNGAAVAIIEVKNKACQKDVEEMVAKKLPDFRALFPLYKNHAVYLGLGSMSYADDRVLKKAQELGIGILRQKGDTIENDISHVRAY
ncbi:hypothetical protein FACS189491_04960 [Spirochaetia bacterium]|nr:hypothetical protein FACS189491_04960 [Spirochaetia bacterium]